MGSALSRLTVLWSPYTSARLDTISLTVKPAPCWAISRRAGASVKPAMGPNTARWGREISLIFKGVLKGSMILLSAI